MFEQIVVGVDEHENGVQAHLRWRDPAMTEIPERAGAL